MKKTGLNRYVYDSSVNHGSTDVDNILDIHKYLMKKPDIKCLDLKKKFIGLLSVCTIGSFGNALAFNSEGLISLNNQTHEKNPYLLK